MTDDLTTNETTKSTKTKRPTAKGGSIKVEPMTLDQFRSYLKGIMFVGGPSWRPDREQWEAIVAIIDKLTVDTATQSASRTPQYAVQPAVNGWDQTAPQWAPMTQQSALPTAMDTVNEEGGEYRSPFV